MTTRKAPVAIPDPIPIREAAEIIGVTKERVHQLMREGRLGQPGWFGVQRTLSRAAVEAFAALDRPAGNPHFRG